MIHVVNSGLFTVDHSDNIIDKNSSDIKIATLSKTKMSHLVIPNGQVPNSVNYPTIKSYLELEAVSGYVLEMINQTTIITKQVPTLKNQMLLWNTESDPLVSNELTDYIYWK